MSISIKMTSLNYLILGLLYRKPCTGYELCKVIESTPMALLSDSPGAIYPALKKLQKHEMITGIDKNLGKRKSKEFHTNEAGTKSLFDWLTGPVDEQKLVNDPSTMLLRLSFIDLLEKDAQKKMLQSFESSLNRVIDQLSGFYAAASQDMVPGSQMAFELALTLLQSQANWLKKK